MYSLIIYDGTARRPTGVVPVAVNGRVWLAANRCNPIPIGRSTRADELGASGVRHARDDVGDLGMKKLIRNTIVRNVYDFCVCL